MSDNSKIQWTDHTASPWHGCTHGVYLDADGNEHEHPGCLRCYAETMSKRNPGTLGVWGRDGTRVMSASFHANCRRWNKQAERDGVIRSVFPSICDPFERWDGPILDNCGYRMVSLHGRPTAFMLKDTDPADPWLTMNDLRRDLFATIDACPHLRFLLLTKRPGKVRAMWPARERFYEVLDSLHNPHYRDNVALLTSVSDQATADAMIPQLLECRDLVPVLGVSYEPALGPVDFGEWTGASFGEWTGASFGGNFQNPLIDWLILGGESGPNARPCDIEWIRKPLAERSESLACFVKQLGGNVVCSYYGDTRDFYESQGMDWPCPIGWNYRDGQPALDSKVRLKLSDPKGGDPSEWPEDLRVRQMPKAMATA